MMNRLILTFVAASAAAGTMAQDGVEIRRNQVGCYPQQEKVIVVEGIDPSGKVRVTMPDGKTTKPKKGVRKAVSPWSGKTRYVVDLGELTTPGRYAVSVGNEHCDVVVSDRPYADIAKASLRLFYLIRSGVTIDRGGAYNRPMGHPDTKVLVHNSAASALRPAGTVISSPFGWYDAGDYNKYVVNSAFSIGLMFAAYERQREYFNALSTDIPESDNNTPDLLDEMMFNLRWLLTMQDPEDGGVYHKLTTPRFEGFVMPADCHQPRYVVAKSVTATLDFAAVMADAARLFEPYQQDYPGFAATAAAVAERAYRWAKEHPTAFYRQEQLTTVPLPHQTATTIGYTQPPSDNTDRQLLTHRTLFFDCTDPEAEAALVADIAQRIRRLSGTDFTPRTLGIIVLYRNQIDLIRKKLQTSDFTIDTVERYQGSQRDVIIYTPSISRQSPHRQHLRRVRSSH